MINHCPICGYGPFESCYKTKEELRSSFLICDCCGCEYGCDDTQKYLIKWIENGSEWFDKTKKPDFWDLDIQLKNSILGWPFDDDK